MSKKLLALIIGMIIGQGSLLLANLILIYTNNSEAGLITTSIGISALLLVICDWGGQITQRQRSTNERLIHPLITFYSRLPVFFLIIITIIYFKINSQVESIDFFIYSLFGYAAYTLNNTGILDTRDKEYVYGVTNNLNYLLILTYILLITYIKVEISYITLGALNSIGLIIYVCLTILPLRKKFKRMKLSALLKESFIDFKTGAIITLTHIPGLIMIRLTSIFILAIDDMSAAFYNLIKSISNIYTQLLSLSRRAFYNETYSNVIKNKNSNFFNGQKKINLINIILISLTSTFMLLILPYLGIESLIISASLLPLISWGVTSSYYFRLQLLSYNTPNLVHSIISCSLYISIMFLFKPGSLELFFIIESISGLLSFILIYYFLSQKGNRQQ